VERLAFAALVSARLEGNHLGRAAAASMGLRELARELEGRQEAELAGPLVEYADELERARAAGAGLNRDGSRT